MRSRWGAKSGSLDALSAAGRRPCKVVRPSPGRQKRAGQGDRVRVAALGAPPYRPSLAKYRPRVVQSTDRPTPSWIAPSAPAEVPVVLGLDLFVRDGCAHVHAGERGRAEMPVQPLLSARIDALKPSWTLPSNRI